MLNAPPLLPVMEEPPSPGLKSKDKKAKDNLFDQTKEP